MAKWLGTLEKKLAEHGENSHPELRVFISAEPAPSPEGHVVPQGILENAIKITNEPPAGLHANLHKALDNFTQVQPWGAGETSSALHHWLTQLGQRASSCKGRRAERGERAVEGCVPSVTDLLPVPAEHSPAVSSPIHPGEPSLGCVSGRRCGGPFCKSPC